MSDKCIQCEKLATQNFQWPTSKGAQSANLCNDCASKWWAAYKNTDAGQCLTIRPTGGQHGAE